MTHRLSNIEVLSPAQVASAFGKTPIVQSVYEDVPLVNHGKRFYRRLRRGEPWVELDAMHAVSWWWATKTCPRLLEGQSLKVVDQEKASNGHPPHKPIS